MRECVALWIVLGLVGCGGARESSPSAAAATPSGSAAPGPGDCAAAAEALLQVLGNEAPTADRSKARTEVDTHCTDDRWTAEARDCFGAARSPEAVHACGYNHLTQAQQDKLDKATSELGRAQAGRALEAMERFRDQLCACKDPACVQRVSDEMTRWSQEMSRTQRNPPKMSDQDVERATAIGEKMGQCMQAAMGAGGTTP